VTPGHSILQRDAALSLSNARILPAVSPGEHDATPFRRSPERLPEGGPLVSSSPIPTVTPDQMSQVDRLMASEIGVDVLQLMELAGLAVAQWARERFLSGDARGAEVLILAGSGGNGGDGMVAARLLHAWGARPVVWLSHDAAALRGAAAHQARSLTALGLRLAPPPDPDRPVALPGADLVIDALLGFGLSGPPAGAAARLITAANDGDTPILAVDLPSGLDAGSGEPHQPSIRADATLTLALPKTGLLALAARPYTGDLAVADIGVPPEIYARVGVTVGPLFAGGGIVPVEA
jgi:NAD(P)H-hydrate epimerase